LYKHTQLQLYLQENWDGLKLKEQLFVFHTNEINVFRERVLSTKRYSETPLAGSGEVVLEVNAKKCE
jgi:hypothetical protein